MGILYVECWTMVTPLHSYWFLLEFPQFTPQQLIIWDVWTLRACEAYLCKKIDLSAFVTGRPSEISSSWSPGIISEYFSKNLEPSVFLEILSEHHMLGENLFICINTPMMWFIIHKLSVFAPENWTGYLLVKTCHCAWIPKNSVPVENNEL